MTQTRLELIKIFCHLNAQPRRPPGPQGALWLWAPSRRPAQSRRRLSAGVRRAGRLSVRGPSAALGRTDVGRSPDPMKPSDVSCKETVSSLPGRPPRSVKPGSSCSALGRGFCRSAHFSQFPAVGRGLAWVKGLNVGVWDPPGPLLWADPDNREGLFFLSSWGKRPWMGSRLVCLTPPLQVLHETGFMDVVTVTLACEEGPGTDRQNSPDGTARGQPAGERRADKGGDAARGWRGGSGGTDTRTWWPDAGSGARSLLCRLTGSQACSIERRSRGTLPGEKSQGQVCLGNVLEIRNSTLGTKKSYGEGNGSENVHSSRGTKLKATEEQDKQTNESPRHGGQFSGYPSARGRGEVGEGKGVQCTVTW